MYEGRGPAGRGGGTRNRKRFAAREHSGGAARRDASGAPAYPAAARDSARQAEPQFAAANDGAIPTLPLGALFSRVAQDRPDAIAIAGETASIHYGALDSRSNRLARHLATRGIAPGSVVAVALPRSIDAIVAILAVLKAGAAYLPLDPHHPAERLAFMVRDCGAALLIAQDDVSTRLRAVGDVPPVLGAEAAATVAETPSPAADAAPAIAPGDLAYVMYTSGSTGRPKGVAVTHANIVNLAWQPGFAEITPADVIVQAAPLAFDASTFEIWGALLNGAQLRLAPEGAIDLDQLAETMASGVTIAWLTAGLFAEVAAHHLPMLGGLKQLLTGGDILSVPAVARVLQAYPGLRLTNGYGPTETTVFATTHDIGAADLGGAIPIGRPLRNVQVHILDADLRPLAAGETGELFIAGAGVSLGYHSQSDLTAERFVTSPHLPGTRLYRTGDLARVRPGDGVIEFFGRADGQIKLRGFRIEPGEIEAALLDISGIAEASVQAKTIAGELRLVGYIVATPGGGIDDKALRQALAASLPDYMIPAAFVRLDRLPLTANGKLDRNALPDPAAARIAPAEAPRDAAEARFCRLFAEVTGTGEVGPEDDFFLIGGHSLAAMRLVARVRAEAAGALTLRDVFTLRTPRALAAAAGPGDVEPPEPVVPGSGFVDGAPILSPAQVRLWLLEQIQGAPEAYNIPLALELRGPLDEAALARALADVVARHVPLRTQIEDREGVPAGRLAPVPDAAQLLPVEPVGDIAAGVARLHDAIALPFDSARDLMLRARLFRCGPELHLLGLVIHHGAADGESLPVLLRDLSAAYAARRAGAAPGWDASAPSYPDHVAAHQHWLAHSDEDVRQLDYWCAQLSPAPPPLDLPTDRPRVPQRSRAAGELPIRIAPAAARRLRHAADRSGTTVFAMLAAAYAELLGSASGQDDVVMAIPVAGRETPGHEALVGLLANALPLRVRLPADSAPAALIAAVQAQMLGALSHADLGFERIVQATAGHRSEGDNPLFRAAMTWQGETPGAGADFPGLAVTVHPVAAAKAKFDLTLSLQPDAADGIVGGLEYDASLFDTATVRRWLAQWYGTVRALVREQALHHHAAAARDRGAPAVPAPASLAQPSADPLELRLRALFAEITGTADVAPDDDFFLIGGHSLSAMRLVARIKAETGAAFAPALLFRDATPRGCAAAVHALRTAREPDVADARRPFFCVPGIGGSVMSLRHLASVLGDRPLVALGAAPGDPLGESVGEIAARQIEAVRYRQPAGPYLLGGYSFGGLVAYEMARQLRAQGETVALLAIIDSRWPERIASASAKARALGYWLGNLPGVLGEEARNFSWPRLSGKFTRLARRLIDRARGRAPQLDTVVDAAALDPGMKALWASHLAAAVRYVPEPCRVPIELFRARIQPAGQPWCDRTFGWRAAASQPVAVHVIPGNHLSMLAGLQAPLLAAKLTAALDRAEAAD